MSEKTAVLKQAGSDLQCSTPAQLVPSCSAFLHSWFPGVYFACTAGNERVKFMGFNDCIHCHSRLKVLLVEGQFRLVQD